MKADDLQLYFINTNADSVMQFNTSKSSFQVIPGMTTGTSGWGAMLIVATNGTLKGC